MNQEFTVNENKINNWLEEVNNDRNKLFNDIKTTTKTEPEKEAKIKSLENLQRSLLGLKKILSNEKRKDK